MEHVSTHKNLDRSRDVPHRVQKNCQKKANGECVIFFPLIINTPWNRTCLIQYCGCRGCSHSLCSGCFFKRPTIVSNEERKRMELGTEVRKRYYIMNRIEVAVCKSHTSRSHKFSPIMCSPYLPPFFLRGGGAVLFNFAIYDEKM